MSVIAIRTVVIYVLLILSMRLMGKRQLGDLQPVELVVTLLIADLAAIPMQEPGIPLLYGLVPIFILVSLEILLSSLMLKSPRFSRLVSGSPVVVIANGQIIPKSLKKLRLTLDDLTENLRGQGVFDLREVHTAIVETNGTISAYLWSERRPVTRADLSLNLPNEPIPMVIVSDGKLCEWSMSVCGWDRQRCMDTLSQNNCPASDVFLMIADADGKYTIVPKGERA